MQSTTIPPGYTRIRRVNSFQELVATSFADGVNALCWERTLAGDFSEVVAGLEAGDRGRRTENGGQMSDDRGIMKLDETRLRSLRLGAGGQAAINVMLEDLRLLRELGRSPELNCIQGYPRDEEPGPVPTDVYSFHADSAPVEADTWLCTYHGAPSEGLRNDEALRRVDVPATRAELLRLFGGPDNDGFRDHLRENCYDLHYAPVASARPWSFGPGNLWRIAVDWPGNPVPPCVHRAPSTRPGDPARLLLIS